MRLIFIGLVLSMLNGASLAFAGPIKILALGDSYTIGHGVDEQESWPEQLKERLKANGIPIEAVDIIARSGWTSRDLLTAVERSKLNNEYDVVLVLIGANDQFQGRPVNDYSRDLKALLRKAVVFSKDRPSHVILVSVPDWAFSPYAAGWDPKEISAQIDEFNQAAKDLADVSGLRWVNITALSREMTGSFVYIADGLHPTGETYAAWVDVILTVVEDIIAQRTSQNKGPLKK